MLSRKCHIGSFVIGLFGLNTLTFLAQTYFSSSVKISKNKSHIGLIAILICKSLKASEWTI